MKNFIELLIIVIILIIIYFNFIFLNHPKVTKGKNWEAKKFGNSYVVSIANNSNYNKLC